MSENKLARYGQAFKDRTVAREIGVGVDTLERWCSEPLSRPSKERIRTAAARLEAVITTGRNG